MFGGTNGRESLGDLHVYQPSTRSWKHLQGGDGITGPVPPPRSHHSATAIAKSIIFLGGQTTSATPLLSHAELYMFHIGNTNHHVRLNRILLTVRFKIRELGLSIVSLHKRLTLSALRPTQQFLLV